MFIVPLAIGIGGFYLMTSRSGQDLPPREEAQVAVRVIDIDPMPRAVTATGFGRVAPVHEWSAISEVQGRVLALAPDLAVGYVVEAGTVLVEIDPTDYRLSIERAMASIASVEAQLRELDLNERNTTRSLDLQERILEVAQTDYERVEELVERGTNTRSALEAAQSALLTQESAVLNLQNTLDLIPAQRSALEASLAAEHVALSEAQTALERTTITAPFRGRVATLNVETAQFARSGDVLMTLQAANAVEVVSEVQPGSFIPVATSLGRPDLLSAGNFDTARAAEFLTAAGMTATVRLQLSGVEATYPAQIVRLRGTIAEDTGTLGVVVQVDDPLRSRPDLRRPPLNVGTFVSVDLTSPANEPLVTIPRSALRYDDAGRPFVYIADAQDQLEIRPVTPGFVLEDEITVAEGLTAGDRLILSDPRPPIPGLKLVPIAAGGN